MAALPHRARAADVPRAPTGSTTARQPASSPTRWSSEARQRRSDRAGAGLSLRAAAADDPRAAAARRPSSPSGTSRGRTRKRSASARGASELLDGLLGSSDPRLPHPVPLQQLLRHASTASSKRASTARPRRSRTAASARWCSAIRSRSSGRAAGVAAAAGRRSAARTCCASYGLPPDVKLGVGVDRLDYTKGIVERLPRASSGCSSSDPSWIGRFTFVQIAAPSRADASTDYQQLHERVRATSPSASTSASAATATSRSC